MSEEIKAWQRPGLTCEERQRLRGPLYHKLIMVDGSSTRTIAVKSVNHGGDQQLLDQMIASGWQLLRERREDW